MDLQKVESFVAVATQLNYTDAAERLFRSQSTVSKQIQTLEKELKVELIDRTHRQISLTSAGKVILPFAKKLLVDQQELCEALATHQLQHGMKLKIRAIPSIIHYEAFNLFSEFHSMHPEVELDFSEAEPQTLFTMLKNGTAEIIFFRLLDEKIPRHSDVLVTETDRLAVFLPASNPLATFSALSVQQLNKTPLILLGKTTQLEEPVMKLFQANGITPNVTYAGQHIDVILKMVTQKMDVTILMDKSVDLEKYPTLKKIPFLPEIRSKLIFIRQPGQHLPAADLFWAFTKQYFQ